MTLNIKTTIVIGIFLILIAIVYFLFDPSEARFFPPCPISYITGLKCPGCGSQRALHSLLHLDVSKAFFFNPLLVMSLPYVVLGIYFEYFGGNTKFPKARKILFGRVAIIVSCIVVVLYWIGRNVF